MCMYKYYVYIHTYIYIYIYIYICTYARRDLSPRSDLIPIWLTYMIYMHICMCMCKYIYARMCKYTYIYVYMLAETCPLVLIIRFWNFALSKVLCLYYSLLLIYVKIFKVKSLSSFLFCFCGSIDLYDITISKDSETDAVIIIEYNNEIW